jgi:hypothetical protein
VELCRGHVINQAFRNSARNWVVQRADVDSFFGRNFEAEFIAIQEVGDPDGLPLLTKVFADKDLYRMFRPKILLNGVEVEHFFTKGALPKSYTNFLVEQQNEDTSLGVKLDPQSVVNSENGDWELEITKDIRLSALVSLIKATHLTLFHMFGYRYILSAPGEYIGRQILGKFFLQTHRLPKVEVLREAQNFFREFSGMVRPIQTVGLGFQGTITDNMFLLCWSQSKGPHRKRWGFLTASRASRSRT